MMKHQFNPTAAARVAVVFLLLALSGCALWDSPDNGNADTAMQNAPEQTSTQDAAKKRRKRRRASDYSRIPVNAPAEWQRQSLGN